MITMLWSWAAATLNPHQLQRSMIYSESADAPFIWAARRGQIDVMRWIWNAARSFHGLQERLIEADDYAAYTNTWNRVVKDQILEWATPQQRSQMLDEELDFKIMKK